MRVDFPVESAWTPIVFLILTTNVVFVRRDDNELLAFGYTNGTWFNMTGVEVAGSRRWRFNHCEPYLRRTFKGTTEEMQKVLADGLAEKAKPPDPDESVGG